MNLEKIRKFLSLFLIAVGFYMIIILTYTIIVIGHYARQKQTTTGYAGEDVITLTPKK